VWPTAHRDKLTIRCSRQTPAVVVPKKEYQMDTNPKHGNLDAASHALSFDEGSPEGVSVIIYMRPERVHGFEGENAKSPAKSFEKSFEKVADASLGKPTGGIRKTYRTGSWFFAGDFLDRVAELSTGACTGLKVRPVQVELTLELDEKAFRNVGLILDSFDNAYRAL